MKQHALNPLKAKSLPASKCADGMGLWLPQSRKDAGKWILRLVVNGRRREMGLGRWPEASIAEARQHTANARKRLREGVDPIEDLGQHMLKSVLEPIWHQLSRR